MTKGEQARADAIADAETLRLMALEANDYFASDYDPDFKCWTREDRTAYWLRDAQHYGSLAVGGAIDFSAERGVEAARAAFRAVPALRPNTTNCVRCNAPASGHYALDFSHVLCRPCYSAALSR